MKMTRSDKIVFLFLKGWTEYNWAGIINKHEFLDALNKFASKDYPNIDVKDYELDLILLTRPNAKVESYQDYYSVERAYELESNAGN